MNCGCIVDPLILLNRSLQHTTAAGNHARPFEGKMIWSRLRQDIVA
jgi:hypothetical protein